MHVCNNVIDGVREAIKYKDAPIIPGVELCSAEGKEIIVYFAEAQQLIDFYERRITPWIKEKNAGIRGSRTDIPMRTLIDMVSEEECVTTLPHPFGPPPRRSYGFFSKVTRKRFIKAVDAIEVFNQTVRRRSNLSALGWAVQHGKGITGGSDGHILQRLCDGVTTSSAKTVAEHLQAIKKGKVHVYGDEMKQHERVVNIQRIFQIKIRNGIQKGFEKGISLSRRAFEQ